MFFSKIFGSFPPKKTKPQEPVPPFPYEVREVQFENPLGNFQLKGTLTLPHGEGGFPGVVLVTGSGAHNRDEQIGEHRPFWVLADFLTRNGIAVLRYDDRHLGLTVRKGWTYTTEDLATDAECAITFLQSQGGVDPKCVGILGHSEGGLIAAMVAARNASLSFVVGLGAPGVDGFTLGLKQARDFSSEAKDAEFGEKSLEIVKSEKDLVQRKRKVKGLHKKIYGSFDWRATLKMRLFLEMTVSPWNHFFLNFKPSTVWQQVQCRTMVLIGENDVQVDAEENLKEIVQALQKGRCPDFKAWKTPYANHFFQRVEKKPKHTLTSIAQEAMEHEQTLMPEVLEIVRDWVLEKKKS